MFSSSSLSNGERDLKIIQIVVSARKERAQEDIRKKYLLWLIREVFSEN